MSNEPYDRFGNRRRRRMPGDRDGGPSRKFPKPPTWVQSRQAGVDMGDYDRDDIDAHLGIGD